MADRSPTLPKGIIEDVLVKVDKFIFPMDFVVLDMEEDRETPIILGRPFLTTSQALIDVKNGELTLRLGEDQVKFNLFKNVEFPTDVNSSCMRIDISPHSQDDLLYNFGKISPLEQCLTKCHATTKLDCDDLSTTLQLIETILALEVNEEESILEEEKKTLDGLVLKELPKGLKYAFLGSNDIKLVIISLELDNDMEIKLLNVLGKNLEAFAWSIKDIKGISPSICMHKILMEEEMFHPLSIKGG